ncbi:fimbria/pilus periplasmic chaperone [Providencia stuartii]|uniref:Molecular chaperone n=1 Tax=Providencia stuartii TaxID=588 RepID=A0AAI9DFL2_PROST|nr:molecular chaperone [Providencia stuartii]
MHRINIVLQRGKWVIGLIIMVIVPSIYAQGGISLSQTRVVFNAEEKSAKVTINNQSERVYLINGRVQSTANATGSATESVPFMVTPPLFRLEKESRNTVLVVRNDVTQLPKDRESVFYLSFLAIPSVEKSQGIGVSAMNPQVSIGLRSIIKLFYRPTGLALAVTEAPEKLRFSLQGDQLQVNNPTPYYLTLAELSLGQYPVEIRQQGAMIAPFSHQTYPIQKISHQVSWSVINDYGGLSPRYQEELTR